MRKNDLYTLIKSMSKAEKRHFKLTSSKYDKGSKNNYLRLFDLIDKSETYNEELIARKFTDINLSYTKNYLFNCLMKSLRDFHSEISEDAQLKDMMRDAEILFRRGLYELCYSVLERAKEHAIRFEKFLLLLEILECERKVFLRLDKSEEISKVIVRTHEEEKLVMEKYVNLTQYRDLSRKIFMESRKNPAPTQPEDLAPFDVVFSHPLLENEDKAISFEALFNYHNILSIYYHATTNLEKLYEQRKKVVELFDSKKACEILGYDGMFVALNNYVVACACHNRHDEALQAMQKLKSFSNKIINFNKTHFTITFTLELSILLYQKKFKDAYKVIQEYLKVVNIDAPGIPSSQIRILNFSIAYILFANGQPREAMKSLDKIHSDKENTSRPDLAHFSLLLGMLIQLDQNTLQAETIERYMSAATRSGNFGRFEEYLFRFASDYICSDSTFRKHEVLSALRADLTKLFEDRLQSRVLYYFDIMSWIESKIQGKALLDVISSPASKNNYSFFPNGFALTVDKKGLKTEKAES